MHNRFQRQAAQAVLVAPIVAALIIFGAACGGKSDKSSSSSPAAKTSPAAAATTAPAAAAQVIQLHATDIPNGFVFAPATLQVKPGEITIKYTNDSVRNHNIVVKSKDGTKELAHSTDLNQGESNEVKFTVTEEGAYQFLCDHTGHADRGLRSTLTVSKVAS